MNETQAIYRAHEAARDLALEHVRTRVVVTAKIYFEHYEEVFDAVFKKLTNLKIQTVEKQNDTAQP